MGQPFRRIVIASLSLAVLMSAAPAWAQRLHPDRSVRSEAEVTVKRSDSEIRRGPLFYFFMNRPAKFPREWRTIDGTKNNRLNERWGCADSELLRMSPPAFEDGSQAPSGSDRPSARLISNIVVTQQGSIPNSRGLSDMFWQWGQFLDHDLDKVAIIDPPEPFNIPVPQGDPLFDPFNTGTAVIRLNRSFYSVVDGTREPVNELTAYIDASNVYGSDDERAAALRTLDGTGRLKTSEGGLLPFNTAGIPNDPSTDSEFFIAGDTRVNEQVGLICMHTLFVREHNHWAGVIGGMFRFLDGDTIYEVARAIVAAEMQAITYNEFLPLLLGPDALGPYGGYSVEVNPGIKNEFATAAYRFGHTMLSPILRRLDAQGNPIPEGHIDLLTAFFNPFEVSTIGIEPYLRGLATQHAQEVDTQVIDDVRNFLFGPPGAGGFDLPALNIQRGRDHGLPDYNQVRRELGLEPVTSFADIGSDSNVQAKLEAVYESVDLIDLWVGGLAEDKVDGAMVGETFHTILTEQFRVLRDGDRFWYQAYLPPFLVGIVERQTLATIIRRNTTIGDELQDNVFLVP
jgi:peroxidase